MVTSSNKRRGGVGGKRLGHLLHSSSNAELHLTKYFLLLYEVWFSCLDFFGISTETADMSVY